MISKFGGRPQNIKDLIKIKGVIQAVKCAECGEASAFDLEDIKLRENKKMGVLLKATAYVNELPKLEGYVTCPWCGHEMFVAEWLVRGKQLQLCRKYWSTIEE